jgi:ketosteroid isomerase-like protein
MTQSEKIIEKAFLEYVEAFQTLDARAAVSYCYLPCSLITDRAVVVVQDAAAMEILFHQLMNGLEARDYARSELSELRVKQVSAKTGFLSVDRTRYKTDGEALERLSETYVLRHTDTGWKIAVAVVQDPGTLLQLD